MIPLAIFSANLLLSFLLVAAVGALIVGTVIGESRKPHLRRWYIIEIDGVQHSGWSTMTGLKKESQDMEYWEGGAMICEKQPSRLQFEDLVLERPGVTGDTDMDSWATEVADAAANGGLPSPEFKRNLDVVQIEQDGTEQKRWSVYNAYVKAYTPGDMDGASDDPTMEQSTLRYDYFELVYDAGGA